MTHPEKTTENVNRGERASSVLPKKRVEDGGFWFMLYGGKGDRGGRAIWMRVISNYCCIPYSTTGRGGGKRAPVRDLISLPLAGPKCRFSLFWDVFLPRIPREEWRRECKKRCPIILSQVSECDGKYR